MRSEVQVRRAAMSDQDAIQHFIRRNYGDSAQFKGPNRWDWQFINNPFRPQEDICPNVWVAWSSDRVVGQIAVQDGQFWLEDRCISASWIVDVMVDRDFRGQGIGHKIHDAVMNDRDALITLTMAPATRRIAERAGCLNLGETRLFIAPQNISGKTVSRFLRFKGDGKRVEALINAFCASSIGPKIVANTLNLIALKQTNSPCHGQVEEVESFDAKIDVLWHKTRDHLAPSFIRDSNFLNWRFKECPGLDYRRFILKRDNEIFGYVVTRRAHEVELPFGTIADIGFLPGDFEASNALLAHAREVLKGCEYLEAAGSSPFMQTALSRFGFVPTRRISPTFVCTNPELRALLKKHLNDWHFTKADHDWDQVHPLPL